MTYTWACPDCNSTDLTVQGMTTLRLHQDPDDPEGFWTEADGDHEWDDSSFMTCLCCGRVTKEVYFRKPIEENRNA